MVKATPTQIFSNDKGSSEYRVNSCPIVFDEVIGYLTSEWSWVKFLHWRWLRETPISGVRCLCIDTEVSYA